MDKFYPGILGHRPLLIVLHGSVARHLRAFRGGTALSAAAPGAEGKGLDSP